MEKNFKFYLKLFSSTFYLSAFTFGGGFVIIPLMKKQFVDKYKWIEEDEMIDLIAIAQSSPGAVAVNAAILIGYRLAGIKGAVVTAVGTVFPPLIILSVVSMAYTQFRDNTLVRYALKGMQAGVAAVVIDTVISMMKDIFRERKILADAVMAGAFIAAFFMDVKVSYIMLVCAALGVISVFVGFRKEGLKSKDTGGEDQ